MKNSGIEWIGEIPDDWEVVYLSSIFEEHKRKNTGLICNNLLSLSYGKIKRKDINTNDGLLPGSFEGYNIIDKGDIVLRLTDLQNDQKSLRTGIARETGIVTSAYVTIRCIPKIAFPEYMHYYLHSFDTAKGFYGMGDGVRQGLNYDGIKKIKILLPSVVVQQKIADYLDKKCAAVDRLIENQQKQIEKLKEYKQSVITEAVTKGLDPSVPMKDGGVEWIGQIPMGWETNRLKYCTTYNDEILKDSTPKEEIIRYVEIGSVSLEDGVKNIENYTFKEAPSRARRIARKGDIIISTVRTYLKAIASIKEEQLIVSTGFCVLRSNHTVNNGYLEYFCKSNIFTDYVSANSYGISYPAINATSLVAFHIVQPPTAEQQQIADYLDKKCAKIDKLISVKQQKIDKLNEYKKSLIYEYVTGKKRVG